MPRKSFFLVIDSKRQAQLHGAHLFQINEFTLAVNITKGELWKYMLKMFIPFLISMRAFFCHRRWFLLGLAYAPAFLSARSWLWQMHHPPFYSKQLTSESTVSTTANAASWEGLHSVAIEKSAGPFGAPWDILDLCIVPADMTRSSDMSLESHQERFRVPQILSDASGQLNQAQRLRSYPQQINTY